MNLTALEKSLGVTFRDKLLLQQALTHQSYLNENRLWPMGSNERMEFLGDAVIELVVTTHLYQLFPDKPEGELTEFRARLVSTVMLAEIGSELKLYDRLYMARGERKDSNARKCERLTACVFESVVGAIYLDQGYQAATEFLRLWLLPRATDALAKKKGAKSTLQEKAQAELRLTPLYEVIQQHGLDHDKHFIVGVYFGETLVARGRGASKKLAEEDAARAALEVKGWDTSSIA